MKDLSGVTLNKEVLHASGEGNGGNNTFHRILEVLVSIIPAYRYARSGPIIPEDGMNFGKKF